MWSLRISGHIHVGYAQSMNQANALIVLCQWTGVHSDARTVHMYKLTTAHAYKWISNT